jgi:hypothetical protein
MGNFIQATEHDLHMYAKFRDFTFYVFFVNKYSRVRFIGIGYKAIRHKTECGHTYYHDLVKRILKNFILYFYDIYSIFYEF